MIDYLAVKEADGELEGNPSAEDAAKLLNERTVSVPRTIPAKEIKKLWGRWGVLGLAWVKAQNTALPDELRAICRATYDNLMGDLFQDMDPADETAAPDIIRYLDALQGAGVLTLEQRELTLALAFEERPQREAWGFQGLISYTDIEKARAM